MHAADAWYTCKAAVYIAGGTHTHTHRGIAVEGSRAVLDRRPVLAGHIAWSKLQTRCQLLSPGSAQQPSVALRQAEKAFASLLTALGEHIGVGTHNNTIGPWLVLQRLAWSK